MLTKQKIKSLCLAAKSISDGSTDPYRHVGAIITDSSGNVISSGCNGFLDSFKLSEQDLLKTKEERKPLMIHAEINALAHLKKGDGEILFCTLKPCPSCFRAALANGIKSVFYIESKDGLEETDLLAEYYNILLQQITIE